MEDPLATFLEMKTLDMVGDVTLDDEREKVVKRFDPPREGRAIRCRSMI